MKLNTSQIASRLPSFDMFKVNSFYHDYYKNKNLVFFILSLIVGCVAFFMSGGKLLTPSYLTKLPTLDGVVDAIDQYKFLILLYVILFAFSPKRKLAEIKHGNLHIGPLVIHAAFWETIVFYIGLYSAMSLILKVVLPTQALTAANWQIVVVFFHYFAVHMPVGFNFSMLFSVLIVNIVYAIFHLNQIVVSKNNFDFRPIDWLYFALALAASKSFFYNYLSHGLMTAVIVLALLYLIEILIARLVYVIRS